MNAVLFSCGCCGTAVSTIGAVPDPEEHSQITAWFPDALSRDRAVRQLEVLSAGPSGIRLTIEAGLQQDEDWLARWREGQQPFVIGQRLLVVPGEDDPSESLSLDRHVLRITPGMAFGTGHHETTRFCLEQLEAAAGSGNPRAELALTLFAYRARKAIGAYLAVLGGADAIVFTGGAGTHATRLRQRILVGLEGLGIRLDPVANTACTGGEARISEPGSAIALLVVAANEELLIAREAAAAPH